MTCAAIYLNDFYSPDLEDILLKVINNCVCLLWVQGKTFIMQSLIISCLVFMGTFTNKKCGFFSVLDKNLQIYLLYNLHRENFEKKILLVFT